MFGRSVHARAGERRRSLPGDDLLTDPMGSLTHAVTIRRPRHDVWRWLVQMGAGRAGWYSYDFVDNGGHPSAERILPEFQSVAVGTVLPAVPGATDGFFVIRYEPERTLVSWLAARAQRRSPGDLDKFFQEFSRRQEDWLVTVRVMNQRIGAQVVARELPLEGIVADPEATAISIHLGRGPEKHVEHPVEKPRRRPAGSTCAA